MGVVNDGGCERVGFVVVDHTQIDRWQTLRIDLGVAGHCMCGSDSVLLHSRNSFLPDDSRNHSGGI